MILSHLTGQPQFKYLKRQKCYSKFVSLLGAKWQKAIAFVYIKNETLFVAVTHPGFKMELNYNKDLLKSVLTQLGRYDDQCVFEKVRDVIVFHSKYRSLPQNDQREETVPHYHELAYSDFTIYNNDPDLKAKFEETKRLIQCNQ